MTDKAKNFLLYQFQNCIRNREIQGKEWKGKECSVYDIKQEERPCYWLLSKRVVKRKSDSSGQKMVSNSFDKIINWFRIL